MRLVPRLLERSEITRARAEHRDPLAFGDAPENAGIGVQRRAVVEHDRCARRECRDEPVPHHPTGRREIEHDVAGPNVRVQHVLLAVLEQRAARAVHDAFGHARGAGGIQNVERMRERHGFGLELRVGLDEVGEQHPVRQPAQLRCAVAIRDHDDRAQLGQPRGDRADERQRVDALAVVEVAIRREQHLRLDLPEAIENRVRSEVRRARRPDGADARGREHRDDGFGSIRDESRDAVAAADAERAQACRDTGDLPREIAPAELAALAALVRGHDRGARAMRLQQVRGEAQRRAFEPARAGHLVAVLEHRRVVRARTDAAKSPDGFPKLRRLRDAPLV